MDYSQAWNNLAPASGLMSWASPQWGWGTAGQTSASPIPQTGVAALQGRTEGEGTGAGYSTPTNQNTGPQTPADMQRANEVMGQLGGYGVGALGKTGLNALGAMGMGYSPSISDIVGAGVHSLANPGGLASLGGGIASKQMGFTGPTSTLGKTALGGLNTVAGGLLSAINPAFGLAYAALSPFAVDYGMDAVDARKDEAYRDAMEDAHGSISGRSIAKDLADFAGRAGFNSIESMAKATGYSPADLTRGMTNKDATSAARGGNPMGTSYGGWGGIGGPEGGARAVDAGYGRNMGGFAGLGIGNPSSYGGGSGGNTSDRGGFGANDGDSDTAGNGGYGR